MIDVKMVIEICIFALAFLFLLMAFVGKKENKKVTAVNEVKSTDKQPEKNIIPQTPQSEPANNELTDSRDEEQELSADDKQTLFIAMTAFQNNTYAVKRTSLSVEWYNMIDRLVNDANTIIGNAQKHRYPPCSANYLYYKGLYYRSITAGNKLEEAEQLVGNKVLELHSISFNQITAEERREIIYLQKVLPQLQSLLCRYKFAAWNNTHSLKALIRDCGSEGYNWYYKNLSQSRLRY